MTEREAGAKEADPCGMTARKARATARARAQANTGVLRFARGDDAKTNNRNSKSNGKNNGKS
jgi:hypothetical protein